jgi:hypothetical protein
MYNLKYIVSFLYQLLAAALLSILKIANLLNIKAKFVSKTVFVTEVISNGTEDQFTMCCTYYGILLG